MGKSPAYKRKLRRSQKLKKRQKLREYKLLHGNGAHQGSAELERKAPVGENGLCEELSASGSNNGLQADSASHKESAELESGPEAPVGATSACEELGASVSENESSSNNGLQADNLRKELAKANKHIQYYRNKIEKQEQIIDVMEEACVKRIQFVRHFWRNKIYQEESRAGKILKKAMQY